MDQDFTSQMWNRRTRSSRRMSPVICGCGCGVEFVPEKKADNLCGLYFSSPQCFGKYQTTQYLIEMCGPYLDLALEYLNGFASLHYSSIRDVRSRLAPFFLYLTEEGILIEDVTPSTITSFLTWAEESDFSNAAHDISVVSTFFKWAIAEERYKRGNPVVNLIHRAPKKQRLPRPFEAAELALMWEILEIRGNSKLRLAAAIALEGGLRISEICRLRLSDIDLTSQSLFVQLPTKNKRERPAFFSELTMKYAPEWMADRDSSCGHDFLFHNTLGLPLSDGSLRREFKRTLCKVYEGKFLHESGFDRWSIHRLRHTMASNLVSAGADAATVMAAGGWVTHSSMMGYARVDQNVARRGYDEAMSRVQEQKLSEDREEILTPAEFLKLMSAS